MSKCSIAVSQFLDNLGGSLEVTVIQSNPNVLLESETAIKAEEWHVSAKIKNKQEWLISLGFQS